MKFKGKLGLITAILVLSLLIGGGYYIDNQLNKNDNHISSSTIKYMEYGDFLRLPICKNQQSVPDTLSELDLEYIPLYDPQTNSTCRRLLTSEQKVNELQHHITILYNEIYSHRDEINRLRERINMLELQQLNSN